jgi:hypothetical protein
MLARQCLRAARPIGLAVRSPVGVSAKVRFCLPELAMKLASLPQLTASTLTEF